MRIEVSGLGKKYKNEIIFKKIDFDFNGPKHYAITGNNGSGKSTLLKTISGTTTASKGDIICTIGGAVIAPHQFYQHFSYAAPYMDVPEDLSLIEFFHFHNSFKPFASDITLEKFLDISQLKQAANKLIASYSSGMKQRVRILSAVLSEAPILFLDEPCSNMDQDGVQWYQNLLKEYTQNKLVLIASNELEDEIKTCATRLDIRTYK